MEKGKRICNVLKEVRLEIAKANDIQSAPNECHHEGPCAGTCPACEAEVRYLEQQLQLRRVMGRAVVLTGIAAGLTSLTACGQSKLPNSCENDSTVTELAGDVAVDGYMEEPEPEVEEVVRGKMPVPVDTITPVKKGERVLTGVVEYQPQFPGGKEACEQFIKENLRYPADAEPGVEGRVIVSFLVNLDGTLSDIHVVKSLGEAFDNEALRVVKLMPKWSPGAIDGQRAPRKYVIPVIFKKE